MQRLVVLQLSAVALIAGCTVDPRLCQPSDTLRLGQLWTDERSSCDQAIARGGPDTQMAYAYRMRARTWTLPSQAAPALRDADAAIRLRPDDSEGYVLRAEINRGLGRGDRAIADLTAALARSQATGDAGPYTDRRDLYWERGELYASAGLRDQAAADYGGFLRQPARPFDDRYARALDHRAELNLRRGRLDEALHDYDEVLRRNPEDAWALWTRGSIKAHRGDAPGADTDIAAARRLDPRVEHWGSEVGIYPAGLLSPPTSRLWLRPAP
jgi:tetratricopeptide (TPR) repeat protein